MLDTELALYTEVECRRECRRSFLAFAIEALKPFGQRPAAHHRLLISELQQVADGVTDRLMVLMPPGSAKALALDTPIPTPGGWRNMGELRRGDVVFDERGMPCNVVWTSPIWRDRPIYKLTTDCGDEILADHEHEWRVQLCRKPRRKLSNSGKGRFLPLANRDDPATQFKLKETWELARRRAKRPMIERALALDLPDLPLILDPYVLGVWLGDGSSKAPEISSSSDDLPWMRAEFERLGFRTTFAATNPTRFGFPGVRDRFVRLRLLANRRSPFLPRKHIPAEYMRASARQRRALLQGLVDTDGTVSKHTGEVTFTNTNRELAEGVRELVRSLGAKAGWSEGRAMLKGKDCGAYYKVFFFMAGAARMPRKAVLCRDAVRTRNTYISVESCGRGDTMCIEVDSPSHLFLCGRSMTPTHNSFYATRLFTAWLLARGNMKIIGASHTGELADDFSGKIQDHIRENGDLLGYGLKTKAVGRWYTNNGGSYLSVGVRSGVPGYRADHVSIDDPVKGRAAADSPADRKAVWDWYNGDLERRLTPRASILLVLTPWHEADLAGELLRTEAARWRVVRMPAEAEAGDMLGRTPGEWLWSDDDYGYGAELAGIKAALSARGAGREWSSQYQGRPVPDTGDYFRREWLIPVKTIPPRESLRIFGGSDYAVTKDGGDYTVHAVVGLDSDDRLYLLDLWRHQTASDQWVESFCDLVILWHPLGWAEELGQIKSGVGPFLVARSRVRKAFVARTPFPTRGDKSVRAQSFRGRMALNGLHIAEDAPFRADLEGELFSFPAGKHDDIVDALGLCGQLIDRMFPPGKPPAPPPPRDSWDRVFNRDDDAEDSYRTV